MTASKSSSAVGSPSQRWTLTPLEARLLRYLATFPSRLVSRDELLTHVWHVDPRQVQTRSVDVALGRLRRKLRDDGERPAVLITVRGRGVRLKAVCDA